jgi:patatin-like phospholipase/acyl hydrolase
MNPLVERLTQPGPKRILSIDGGGIRGALALGFLARLEQLLRERHGNQATFRLSDYFDLIGGTSTGAIIATCLSLGMSVAEVKALYAALGGTIFGQRLPFFKRFRAKFSPRALEKALQTTLQERTLSSPDLLTGLCIVAKRADTGSTWPLLNHPNGTFYEHNKGILLRQAVRASSAAPTFFEPEKVEVGRGEFGAFVDGGVSMYNNPALLLFLIATLKGFPFHWPTGADQLLIVSVGTGISSPRFTAKEVLNNRVWNWARQVPDMLMRDASSQSHLLLQYLSQSPTRSSIDLEISNMQNDLLGDTAHLSYLRYNVELETNQLQHLGITGANVTSLGDMSNAKNMELLEDIGERAALNLMLAIHFPSTFDIV